MTQERGFSLSSKYVVVCCTWKAKKPVHLLSTTPEELQIGQVERRLRSDGRWQTNNFAQPKLGKLYNPNMGGVDLIDQRIAPAPGV